MAMHHSQTAGTLHTSHDESRQQETQRTTTANTTIGDATPATTGSSSEQQKRDSHEAEQTRGTDCTLRASEPKLTCSNEMERSRGDKDTIAANKRTMASEIQKEDPVKLERYLEKEAQETDSTLDRFLEDREGFTARAKRNNWRYAKKDPDALADDERMWEANKLHREAKKMAKSKGRKKENRTPVKLSRLIIMEVMRHIVECNTMAEALEYLERVRTAALAVAGEVIREQWQQAAPVFTHMQEWIREREQLGQLTVDDQIIRQLARMLFTWKHGVCKFGHAGGSSGEWELETLDVDAIRGIK